MDLFFNTVSELLNKVAGDASSMCAFVFFEQEVPKSLREE